MAAVAILVISLPGGGRIKVNNLPFRDGRMRPNETADWWEVTPPAAVPGSSLYTLPRGIREIAKDPGHW